jgi:type I restriction enzyme R subunit
MNSAFTENTVEETALVLLESVSWQVAHGPDVAPDVHGAGHADYGEAMLAQRLRDALNRHNTKLPIEGPIDRQAGYLARHGGADAQEVAA